jgi:predicted DNA-binding transcriptional regulator YafY
MRKRPDTIETLYLAMELLRRIPRNRKVTATQLHEALKGTEMERDLRTIQRHLNSLSKYFDIERDERNKPYGYKWSASARGLAIPMLSEQESLLLTLAEQQLRNLLPAGLMKSMDGFFSQARTNLGPLTKSDRDREWLSKVRVVSTTQPLLPAKIKQDVFEAVSNALYGNRWLQLDYKNSANKRGQAEVMPLGLAQQGSRLYLVCRYKGYDNERSLAMHRIVSAEATSATFVRPKDFDLEKYDNDGRFGFGEGQHIRLTFLIDKETGFHLTETPLSTDQQVIELEDQYEISATVVDTAQLDWWLRGFGDAVDDIVKTPVSLSDSGDA